MPTLLLLGSLATLGPMLPTQGAEIEGVVFAQTFRTGTTSMRLINVGLQRYMYFYKVNVAACYIDIDRSAEQILDNVAKRLELQYFHRIRAKDFAFLTDKYLRANTTADQYQAVKDRVQRLNALYEAVKPGDRYALTYVPGKGTELALNGVVKGTIQGADFARAVFSVWLGKNPISSSLRDELLGKR